MKTLELTQLGLDELSTVDMMNTHGGGDSTSLLNIGSITVGDLVDVSGNSLFNGNNALFSGNDTSLVNNLTTLLGFSSSR